MFGSLGTPELIILLVIVLIVFGAGKLGDAGGALGKGIREFRRGVEGNDSEKGGTEKTAEEKPVS